MASENIQKHIDNEPNKTKHKVEYDDLLSAAGTLGLYQWLIFFATAPFYAFGVFVYFSQLFMTEISPNHWCRIPELEKLTDFQRRDLGIPKDVNSRFGYSQCEMYAVKWTDVLAMGQTPNVTWNTIPCQYGWEFNKSEIPYPTISSELEWVCKKNSYQATAQAIFFAGSIFGGFLFGWVADRYGRIPAIISSCLVACVGGLVSTFTRNLIEFASARFIMGMAYDTCMAMAYLLFLELIAPEYRTLMFNLGSALFYSLFLTVLPWIALACAHWKTISLVTSLPFALAVFTKFILPESPRWLLSKGRVDEAIEKILYIGRVNKKEVPSKMVEQFKLSLNSSKEENNQNWLEIFRRPIIRKIFILVCLEYMCCTLIFDALVRSIGQLDFDFFLSFSVISFTELPSVVIVAFIMDHTGRRWLCIFCMATCCISCLLTVLSSGVLTVIFAVSARFAVNMAVCAGVQWTAEILPTSVRGSGAAIVHICGYATAFLSPYIMYLKEYIYWLPLTVVGGIALLGMSIAFALPETALKDMPHTFEEAEELTRNQRLWTLPFLESRKGNKKQKGHHNHGYEAEA